MISRSDLFALVTAHGVRGRVPEQIDETIARALGEGFVRASVPAGCPGVVVGHDVRTSSPALARAFVAGVVARGVDVVDLGECASDEVAFAAGSGGHAAAYVTACGDPAEKNGMRWWGPGARSLAGGAGVEAVVEAAWSVLRAAAQDDDGRHDGAVPDSTAAGGTLPDSSAVGERGTVRRGDVLADLADLVRSTVDLSGVRPLKVVVDAANGPAARTVGAVLGEGSGRPSLPVEVVPVFFEADGTFPYHDADPTTAVNLVDLQAAMVASGADAGFAFDGDGGRCVVVDERGARVSASTVLVMTGLGLVGAERSAGRTPVVVHGRTVSRAVPEVLGGSGATTRSVVGGCEAVRAVAEQAGALLGGSACGHVCFRSFFGADSGILTMLEVLRALGSQSLALSELTEVLEPYSTSGEIWSTVTDVDAALHRVVDAYVTHEGAGPVETDEDDGGILVSHWDEVPRWWFGVRVAGTPGRLALTVEAADEDIMEKVRDDVLALVRELDPAPDGEEETDD